MSVSRVQIEVELHTAERALEAARGRREAAEKALWTTVSQSGGQAAAPDAVALARAEVAEANREHAEIERLLMELRQKLENAQHRDERLLAVTDMLMAREDAHRRSEGYSPIGPGGDSTAHRPSMPRRLLDRLRRH